MASQEFMQCQALQIPGFENIQIESLINEYDLTPTLTFSTEDSANSEDTLEAPNYPLPSREIYEAPCKTGAPNREPFPGNLDFQVSINGADTDKKKYMYSAKLNRIYVDMKVNFPVTFSWLGYSEMLAVRVTVVFSDAGQAEKRVERCTQHVHEPANTGMNPNIVRNVLHSAREPDTVTKQPRGVHYCGSESHSDQWYSVVVEFLPNASRTHPYQFVCKNSCSSGINRRSIEIVFELEDARGNVLGRQTVGARVCSCPRRDLNRDEAAAPAQGKRLMKPSTQPLNKKIKLEVTNMPEDNVFVMEPLEIVGITAMVAAHSAALGVMELEMEQNRDDPAIRAKYETRIAILRSKIDYFKSFKPADKQAL